MCAASQWPPSRRAHLGDSLRRCVQIIRGYVGQDATAAFSGGVYKHSRAARNLLASMRVARLPTIEPDKPDPAGPFAPTDVLAELLRKQQ
jgi:hypothetical protein